MGVVRGRLADGSFVVHSLSIKEDRPVTVPPHRVRPAPPPASNPRPLWDYLRGEAVDVAQGGAWVESFVERSVAEGGGKGSGKGGKGGQLLLRAAHGSKPKEAAVNDASLVRSRLVWVANGWTVAPPDDKLSSSEEEGKGGASALVAPPLRSSVRVDAFYRFLYERQAMWERRARGLPPPWTDDPILAYNRFCNVYRELDTGTKFFAAEVARKRPLDRADLVFMAVAYRLLNRVETFRDSPTGVPTRAQWAEHEAWIRAQHRRNGKRDGGKRSFGTPAHQTVGPLKYIEHMKAKPEEIDELLRRVDSAGGSARAALAGGAEGGVNEGGQAQSVTELWTCELRELRGVGPFFAWQCCCDLQEAGVVPEDDLYAKLGPGATDGLLKVYPAEPARDEDSLLAVLLRLQVQQAESYRRMGVEGPHWKGQGLRAKELEHTLCEYSKYVRMCKMGDSSRMLRYAPSDAPPPFGDREGDDEDIELMEGEGEGGGTDIAELSGGLVMRKVEVKAYTPIAQAARLAQLRSVSDGAALEVDDDVALPQALRERVARFVLRRAAARRRGEGGLTAYREGLGCSKCRYSSAGCKSNCRPRLEALNAAMEAERAKAGSDAAGADDAALLERLKAAGWTHTLGGWLTPEETHSKRGKRRLANVASKVAADKRKRTGGNGDAEEAAVDAASDGLAEQVTRVQKRFSDGELYEGTLMHYRPGDAHPYRVEYDDGDTETYTTAEWRKEVKVQRGTCAEI